MTDNDFRETKIAICKKLMEINSCDIHYINKEALEHLCSEIVDVLQNTNLEVKLLSWVPHKTDSIISGERSLSFINLLM